MQPDRDQLLAFIYAEARPLGERRFEDWLALFAEDGRYWVPIKGAQQTDIEHTNSLAYEDRLLLKLRIERLRNSRTLSQQPISLGQHVLQQPALENTDHAANLYELHTPFFYAEARGPLQTVLTGVWRHWLRVESGQLRIVLKRVDLLNPSAAHEAIQLFP